MTNSINILKPHLAINVTDVEASIDFYKRMFGIEPSKVRTGYAKFDVASPGLNFTLNQVAFGERGALSHLGIQVASTDDVVAMRSDWEERGLKPRDEMQTTCCYALQDKAWVNDPDGNEWEVFVVLEDNLAETAPCECGTDSTENLKAESAAACCAPTPIGVTNASAVSEAGCC